MTRYVVLRKLAPTARTDGSNDVALDGLWEELVTLEAHGPEDAIRRAVDVQGIGGTLVATPARSWAPVGVEVESVKKITIGKEKGAA